MYDSNSSNACHWIMGVFGSVVILGLGLSFASAASAAGDPMTTRVAYAGFAMAGRAADLKAKYPYSLPLERRLNAELTAAAKSASPNGFHLVINELADATKGNSIAMALVLDQEKVSVERIASVYKTLIEVSAQIVVFDFASQEGAIIALYPLSAGAYVEVFEQHPSRSEIARLIEQYYFGGLNDMEALTDRFRTMLSSFPIKEKYAQEIGIGQILINPTVLEHVPASLKSNQPLLASSIGRQLATRLAARQGVSSVPAQLDSSVAKMAIRFTGEGSASYFRLPQPDYYIDIAILGLEKSLERSNAVQSLYLYGAHAQIRVRNNGSNQPLFDQALSKGAFKRVPAGSGEPDDWAAMEQTLHSLIEDLVSEVDRPSREFRKEQALTRQDLKQFKQFKEILAQCR